MKHYLNTTNSCHLLVLVVSLTTTVLLLLSSLASCQQQQQGYASDTPSPSMGTVDPTQPGNAFPYYLQSPMANEANGGSGGSGLGAGGGGGIAAPMPANTNLEPISGQNNLQQLINEDQLVQRSLQMQVGGRPKRPLPIQAKARAMQATATAIEVAPGLTLQQASEAAANLIAGQANNCLYDKRYFSKLDQCLARKPYPTIGLPAFKNEDLLIKRGLNDKHGCLFIMNNGLFKNYQITKYAVESDSQCLDGSKVGLSMSFSNVTLSYLWTLRCLNRADQLLEDATLDGRTMFSSVGEDDSSRVENTSTNANGGSSSTLGGEGEGGGGGGGGICVGSSQNFGFTSIQLTNIEAQVELATDIFKNWRVTNVTVAMVSPSLATSTSRSTTPPSELNLNEASGETPVPGTNIKDYVFESLDGDELNWRYLHLYQNWARNRLHANFLDQYRRFLWVSLQRCLSETSERLPVKLTDVFTNRKFN